MNCTMVQWNIDTVVRFAHGKKYTGCRLHTAMDTQWYSLLDCRNCTGQLMITDGIVC